MYGFENRIIYNVNKFKFKKMHAIRVFWISEKKFMSLKLHVKNKIDILLLTFFLFNQDYKPKHCYQGNLTAILYRSWWIQNTVIICYKLIKCECSLPMKPQNKNATWQPLCRFLILFFWHTIKWRTLSLFTALLHIAFWPHLSHMYNKN